MMTQDLKSMPEDYWKNKLTPEQYHVMREKGTEYPGSGEYLDKTDEGMYMCVACRQTLFSSDKKIGGSWMSGWPDFSNPVNSEHIELQYDDSFGMSRTAVSCSNCGSHLGHVFEDDLGGKGSRYCINSISLEFKPGK